MARLFVDMDGVLAVFRNISSEEELYEEGYFRDLEPQKPVLEAIRSIQAAGELEVYILSSFLGDSPYALNEKNAWLDRYLPEIGQDHRLFVPCGKDKKELVLDICETDFLLDDYTHNLTLWQPPARGIKLLNGINHTKGTWKHDRISLDRGAEGITKAINDIVKENQHIYDEKGMPYISTQNTELDKRIQGIREDLRRRHKNDPQQSGNKRGKGRD